MRAAGLIVAGAVWWTLLEYLIHRFGSHRFGKHLGRRHLAHHADVTKKWLAFAPWPSALGGLIVHAVVLTSWLGAASGGLAFAGFAGAYLAYEHTHYATHHHVPRTAVGRYLRAYHLAHHHRTPRARFGVTSPLWDVVFGTYVRVPRGSAQTRT